MQAYIVLRDQPGQGLMKSGDGDFTPIARRLAHQLDSGTKTSAVVDVILTRTLTDASS